MKGKNIIAIIGAVFISTIILRATPTTRAMDPQDVYRIYLKGESIGLIEDKDSLEKYIDKADLIMEEVMILYDEAEILKPIRLLGVGLSNLKKKKEIVEQMDLFTFNQINENPTDLFLSNFNKKIKKGKLIKASNLLK